MNAKSPSTAQSQHLVPRGCDVGSMLSRIYRRVLAILGFAAFPALLLVSAPALSATAPSLGTEAPYGVVSSTLTNTTSGSTITGNVCYTTGPAVAPTINGTTVVPCPAQTGTDQASALADLNGQSCTPIGAAVALNAYSVNGGTPGVFPPGCYSSTGAMSVTTGTTVRLSGAGVYIFRPGGAFNPAANSNIVAEGGACANDVFWAPAAATTIGANSSFVGNVLESAAAASDITIGSTVNFQGRALAYGHTVTIDTDTITVPSCAAFVPPSTPPGGVALNKVFFPTTIPAGGVSRLTITLSNNNVGVATLTSALTDTLPGSMIVAPTPNAVTSCGGGVPVAVPGSSAVTMPVGTTIPGGAPGTCSVTVNVTAATDGSFLNTLPALVTDLATSSVPAGVSLIVSFATGVPTLSEWAMIMLAGLLAIAGFAAMRRRAG